MLFPVIACRERDLALAQDLAEASGPSAGSRSPFPRAAWLLRIVSSRAPGSHGWCSASMR